MASSSPFADEKKSNFFPSDSQDPPISPPTSRQHSTTSTLDLPPQAGPNNNASSSSAPPAYSTSSTPSLGSEAIPTTSHPFTFPPTPSEPLPTYSSFSQGVGGVGGSRTLLLALPQVSPTSSSPFLQSTSPSLLPLGIPSETFLSFLSTLSDFLSAKIPQQALSHASDIASDLGKIPTQVGKNIAKNFVDSGKLIGSSAKTGDVRGVIGGVVGLTFGSVGRVVGGVVSAPGRTVGAVTGRPKTARERCEVYCVVSNKRWFLQRGLRARVVGTGELAEMLGVNAQVILDLGNFGEKGGLRGQVEALGRLIGGEGLSVEERTVEEVRKLDIGRSTLWLVLEVVGAVEGKGKGKA